MSSSAERITSIIVRLGLIAVIVVIIATLAGLMFLPAAVVVDDGVDFVANDLLDVGPLPDVEAPPENSFIFDEAGNQLAEINFEENRQPVPLSQVPDTLKNAVIATEDAKFYEHNGINLRSIARAAIENARSGDIESGASTITQQYVKNALLADRATEQSYERKIIEAVWAVELEKVLTKDEILERYLNRTFFGSGAWGVEAASRRYFSQSVGDLTLAQSAMLAGLIRSPERNSPLVDADNALTRRNIVLNQMMGEGFITEDQRAAAAAEGLTIVPSDLPPPDEPFWTEWVGRLLFDQDVAESFGGQTDVLALMGDTREARIATVFQSGLRIHTTLNSEWQGIAEEKIRDYLVAEGDDRSGIAQEPLGGLVSVEPGSGAIRTMAIEPFDYGSCGESSDFAGTSDSGQILCDKTKVNPLVIGMGASGRQPGSSFKPFVVIAALEAGLPPGFSLNADKTGPIEGCDDNYSPNNAGQGGVQDMYTGIKFSVNQYFAKLTAEIGEQSVASMADRLGLRGWGADLLTDAGYQNIGCSLGLGAKEVSVLEMAVAYATIANRGEYCRPYAIERIEDRDGNVLYEHANDCEQVVDEKIIDRTVDILKGSVTSGGTAPYLSGQLGAYPVRGKTGTTDDSRDAWFVGFVKQLATAAWVGYPNGSSLYETREQAAAACPTFYDGQPNPSDQPEDSTVCPPETKLMENVTIGGEGYRRVFGGTIPGRFWGDYMAEVTQSFEPEGFPDPGPRQTSIVPNVLGMSLANARAKAEDAGFTLVTKTVEDYRPAGESFAQSPGGGTRAEAGNAIVLSISNGLGVQPTVPNVVGESDDNAIRILEAAGYSVQVFQRKVGNPDLYGFVLSQSPSAGTAAPPEEGNRVVSIQVGVARGDGNGDGEPDPTTAPSPPTPTETKSEKPPKSPKPTEDPTPTDSPTADG